jgi:hypothetical protein
MYFGPSISVGRRGVSYGDSDAQAFIAATGLTGTTEVNAVNNLVANLKSYGLWSKMKAIYPFVSDTINLFSYTEDFSNAFWPKNGATVIANDTTAPDGTLTADRLTASATGNKDIELSITLSNTSFSIYAKKGNYDKLTILNLGTTCNVQFDLTLGTYNIVSGSGFTPFITSVGNGWYRCGVQNIASTTQIRFYVGANTSDYLYLWGAQAETSATASTYQPIATTPANRFVSQFKYNLKDARDLDAAFRLAFNGTWTYSKQGATPNGVNAYGNTYLNPVANSLTSASSHLSYYARTAATTGDPAELANYTSGSEAFVLQSKSSGAANRFFFSAGNAASRTVATAPIGYMAGSAVANTRRDLYLNGVSVANNTTTDTATLGNYNLYLGAGNISGSSVGSYSNAQAAFATIGNGLTSTEIANLYTSVQLFQQELSRYVGVPIVSDANAQAFLDAAVITDQTQANAVNTLVTDLKTYGLWTKMKAIYPFVGGTATTHKWNLKDPRDLDAAYRLAFSGAWTHSSTGALPNGANAYADSFLTPLSALTNNNTHLSYYSRTNTNGTFADMGVSGVGPAYTPLLAMYIRDTDNMATRMYGYDTGENFQSANTNSQGLFIGNRTSSTVLNQWKNSTKLGTATYTNGRNITTLNLKTFIGAINLGGTASQYTNRESAFASIGDGLSDTEAANLYTAVQKYQTSLSRQV